MGANWPQKYPQTWPMREIMPDWFCYQYHDDLYPICSKNGPVFVVPLKFSAYPLEFNSWGIWGTWFTPVSHIGSHAFATFANKIVWGHTLRWRPFTEYCVYSVAIIAERLSTRQLILLALRRYVCMSVMLRNANFLCVAVRWRYGAALHCERQRWALLTMMECIGHQGMMHSPLSLYVLFKLLRPLAVWLGVHARGIT